MAVFARYEELRREIDALVAENEELKQLLLLLRENQELKSILRNQYNENTLLPTYESSRIDGQAEDVLTLNSALLDFALGSSTAGSSMVPRGYCLECPIPWHPHLPPSPPSDSDFSSGSIESGTFAMSSPAFLPTDGSPLGSQQWPGGGTGFAAIVPQMDTSVVGSPVRWTPLPIASAGPQPDVEYTALVPVFSPGNLQRGTPSPYSASPQTQFHALVLQNAAPFVQQLLLLAGKARGLPSPGAWSLSAGPTTQPPFPQPLPATCRPPTPLAAPAQAPLELQKLPDVRPEDSSGPRQQDTPGEKTSSESSETKLKDAKQVSMERIVGEIAFQLDRRILSSVFPDRIRLYGFTVRNIPEKVMQSGKDPYFPLSAEQAAATMERYENIMRHLQPLGYDPEVHPKLTELIVNTFGILRERPELTGPEAASYNNLQFLQKVVSSTAPPTLLHSCMLLLNCLHQLSVDDGKPLFIW